MQIYFHVAPPWAEHWTDVARQTVVRSSDATVISFVLDFTSEDEEGGNGRDRNVEDELPRVPQAEQVQVA